MTIRQAILLIFGAALLLLGLAILAHLIPTGSTGTGIVSVLAGVAFVVDAAI